MTNDFVYDMSEINEEEIMKGWEELNSQDDDGDGDYIPGQDDGEWIEYDTDSDWDYYGEEEFA